MSGKRTVSVCRGHELANALYRGRLRVEFMEDKACGILATIVKVTIKVIRHARTLVEVVRGG